jgi:hypothetical protein
VEKLRQWQNKKIVEGEDWDKTIEDALLNADIALLLLSSDFIALRLYLECGAKSKGTRNYHIPIF